MSKTNNRTTSDAVEILRHRFGDSPNRRSEIEQIKQDMAVGEQIHAARKAAGLTQAQLAERIGTTQSVISDLEDAEYEGHTLTMLRRIADALGLNLRVTLGPEGMPMRDPVQA